MTEEIIPNAIRTWTIFKNTNNTLEGIEAIAFAIRQVALDEIEKESDNVVFMSDATVKTIIGTLKRLEQENTELKAKLESYNCNANCYKYKEADNYKQALEEIREIANKACTSGCRCIDKTDILIKINEVLKDEYN